MAGGRLDLIASGLAILVAITSKLYYSHVRPVIAPTSIK
jgi:hypothetical protein